jgi:hypothetical protein
MADSELMLELVRGVRDDVKALRTEVQVIANKVDRNANTISKIQTSDGESFNRLARRALPWVLAALGIGGAGGGLLSQQTQAKEVHHGVHSVRGTDAPVGTAGTQKRNP